MQNMTQTVTINIDTSDVVKQSGEQTVEQEQKQTTEQKQKQTDDSSPGNSGNNGNSKKED